VVALEDVRALVVPAEQFRALLSHHPHMLEVLKRQEYERLDDGRFSQEDADAQRRLAGLLLTLAVRRGHGIVHAGGHQFAVVDIAALEKICGPTATRAPATGPQLIGATRWPPLNHSIFVTDIANFGDPRRDDDDRRAMRQALYRILREALEASNVPWPSCLHEDRGDGVLTIVPPTVSTVSLVDPLVALLAAELKRHNRRAGDPVRIQLRAALHVGPVFQDDTGLCGQALIHAARMLDAPVLKHTLAATNADLAFIASAHVYDTVIRHAVGLVDPAAYQRVRFQVKKSKSTGWMYLAGGS
jgi:hypothetical protein